VEALRSRDTEVAWRITVLAEEPRMPYDRVALTSYFSGRDPQDLSLATRNSGRPGRHLAQGVAVAALDVEAKTVRTSRDEVIAYDELVLATGSYAFVPPVKNSEANGCFVYRTSTMSRRCGCTSNGCAPKAKTCRGRRGRRSARARGGWCAASVGCQDEVVELRPG